MKELDFINFSALPVQILVQVAIVIAIVFVLVKLVKRYLFVFVKSEIWNAKITNSWDRIETGIWLATGSLVLIYLLNHSFLITIVMLAITLVVGGKYWRDVINGVIIKFEHKISEGDFFSNAQYNGVITQLGSRGMQIRMDGGEVAFVPYRNLNEYKIRKVEGMFNSELNSIIVRVKPSIPVDAAVRMLKKSVLQIPYTMLTQPVKIEVVELKTEGSILRVLAHTQNFETGKLLELELNNQMAEQNMV